MVSQGRSKAETIPSKNPVIPRKTVDIAQRVLRSRMLGEPHPITGEAITKEQVYAATDLLKLYQTQDRFTPARIKQLAQQPKASETIRELATLDDDALNRLTEQMLAEDQPTA